MDFKKFAKLWGYKKLYDSYKSNKEAQEKLEELEKRQREQEQLRKSDAPKLNDDKEFISVDEKMLKCDKYGLLLASVGGVFRVEKLKSVDLVAALNEADQFITDNADYIESHTVRNTFTAFLFDCSKQIIARSDNGGAWTPKNYNAIFKSNLE